MSAKNLPPVFDGHNDTVLSMMNHGRSFFERGTPDLNTHAGGSGGHLDLPPQGRRLRRWFLRRLRAGQPRQHRRHDADGIRSELRPDSAPSPRTSATPRLAYIAG
ncbi:MAG: hypothetical protein R2849_07570 [Thermomicrobiales bacterium]